MVAVVPSIIPATTPHDQVDNAVEATGKNRGRQR